MSPHDVAKPKKLRRFASMVTGRVSETRELRKGTHTEPCTTTSASKKSGSWHSVIFSGHKHKERRAVPFNTTFSSAIGGGNEEAFQDFLPRGHSTQGETTAAEKPEDDTDSFTAGDDKIKVNTIEGKENVVNNDTHNGASDDIRVDSAFRRGSARASLGNTGSQQQKPTIRPVRATAVRRCE